jgi:hypothetical protein
MKHLTAIALLLLIAYGVFAASAQAAVDSSAHCRVRVADGTTGSGTLVFKGQNVAYVLTCHHVFDECKSQIVCSFQDGESFYGRLKKENGNDDLSVIAIRPPRLVPVPIGDPAKATSITVCGFGPNAGFRASTGRVIGQTMAQGSTCPTWIVNTPVRPGDSGGAALDQQGRIVGVVWGTLDGNTYIMSSTAFNQILKTQCGGGSCYGGGCSGGSCYGGSCGQPYYGGGCQGGQCYPMPQNQPSRQCGPIQPAPQPGDDEPITAAPPVAPPIANQPIAPAQPPAPTIDAQALKQQIDKTIELHLRMVEIMQSDHTLLVNIDKRPGCNCQPTDLTGINAKLDALTKANTDLVVFLKEYASKQPVLPAPDKPAAPVGAHRLYLRAVPLN